MTDQGNQQFGGSGIPMPGGQNPAGGGFPQPPVPPVPMPGIPMPAPVAPTPSVPMPPAFPAAPIGVPASAPVPMAPPVMPASVPAHVVPGGVPSMSAPMGAPAPAAPAAPKKAMTLEDLAKQTPIFSDDELEEDDFDPWAPLDDHKKDELDDFEDNDQKDDLKYSVPEPVPTVTTKVEPVKSVPEVRASIVNEVSDGTNEGDDEDGQGVIEGSLIEEDDIDPFEGIEDEEENPLKHFLANANINGKKVVGCLVAFAVIIGLIVGLFYGGKFLFKVLTQDKPVQQEVKQEVKELPTKKVEEVVVKEETPKEVKTVQPEVKAKDLPAGWIEPSLYAGVKVGLDAAEGVDEIVPNVPGLNLTPSSENIVQYVSILARIRELYETNIQDMLNSSNDRSRSLSDFIANMKAVSGEAKDAVAKIQARKVILQVQFDDVTAQKQLEEDKYFSSLASNDPEGTNDSLLRFTDLARQSVDIRARYRALDKVEEYMNRFLLAMDTRVRDVDFNREALIKGVKVIDVQGSDINLIIPESNL